MRATAALAIVAAALASAGAANAATTTLNMPFQSNVQVCNGDMIQLSGALLGVFSVTFNAAGGVMFANHTQPQGVRGIDPQTGVKYVGTGVTRDLSVFAPSGTSTITFINRFHIQATSGEQSFDVSQMLHVTQLPDGTVTALVDNFSASC